MCLDRGNPDKSMDRQYLILSALTFTRISAIPIDNSLVGQRINIDCDSRIKADVVLILDGSNSVGITTFERQKTFAMKLATELTTAGATLAVIQYSSSPRLIANDNNNLNLQRALSQLHFPAGSTNTGMALQFAFDTVLKVSKKATIAVVVTDGRSQDDVVHPAEFLRDHHVFIYAVGVSDSPNIDELYRISGNSVRIFTVLRTTVDTLHQLVIDTINRDLCPLEFDASLPQVNCGNDRVSVRAATRKSFEGHVFVKNHFHQSACRVGSETFGNPLVVGITVLFGQCGLKRWRSLNPQGIFVETTVIFMFHEYFMTKVDQAIKVQCFYMEASKTVAVPLQVSMLVTEFRQTVYAMPVCFYSLRASSPDGPVIKFASIGDKVYHRWECQENDKTYDVFGMLVHSCFVDDGTGDRVEIVDSNGCGVDVHLLTSPSYSADLRTATGQSHVFKYADRPVLQFQCQISVCVKNDDQCRPVTPPRCTDDDAGRSRRDSLFPSLQTLDVLSSLVVLAFNSNDIDRSPCMDVKNAATFLIILVVAYFTTVLTFSFLFFLFSHRRRMTFIIGDQF